MPVEDFQLYLAELLTERVTGVVSVEVVEAAA
jgi:hypothetical protein